MSRINRARGESLVYEFGGKMLFELKITIAQEMQNSLTWAKILIDSINPLQTELINSSSALLKSFPVPFK
ncbi:hypothetical protein BpHYR1_011259 [Brachionus plicatilis]|uniref:Uncharacterized protein n=1 Tax=Brachionus plicatilis TaxID=10195 RepID=A0A3M7RC61_BRAPC|nr:hypothetical protein BpHYR1_011259 [Brachionus plicatilis]